MEDQEVSFQSLTIIEEVVVLFNDNSKIKDVDGNNLKTNYTSKEINFYLSVLTDEERAVAQSQANGSIASLFLAFGTSLLFSLILGTQIEASWLLLATLQLMSLTPLFNLNLPPNFREFAKNLAVLNGEPEFLPNVFKHFVDNEGLEPFNAYFELMSK